LIAAGLLALVTFIAASVGVVLWVTAPAPIERDRLTLCPAAAPKDIIVIALDTTDGLPEPTRIEATQRLTDLIEAAPEGALLDLRVVDPAHKAGRVILTLCNPGDGQGLSEFTGNPALAKKVWRERFREPLIRALRGSLNPMRSTTSPLLATFQGIALERFAGARAAAASKRLVIVSDMLEHVPGEYSHYPPADLRYERFKRLLLYRKVRTDLQRAGVDIFYIDRCLKLPFHTGVHIQFWIDWIDDNNGQMGQSIKLQGACQP
jgi:hypothetical protein